MQGPMGVVSSIREHVNQDGGPDKIATGILTETLRETPLRDIHLMETERDLSIVMKRMNPLADRWRQKEEQ